MAALKTLTDTDPMPLGTKKGTKMENLKAWHLLTLWNDGLNCATRVSSPRGEVARYIKDALSALEKECRDMLVKKEDEP